MGERMEPMHRSHQVLEMSSNRSTPFWVWRQLIRVMSTLATPLRTVLGFPCFRESLHWHLLVQLAGHEPASLAHLPPLSAGGSNYPPEEPPPPKVRAHISAGTRRQAFGQGGYRSGDGADWA